MTDTVPLNKLLLSPRNVRKTNAEEDIEGLAESILSKGLLQNLVVSESPTGRGIFEVDAGGRRWRALQLLVRRKELARDWPVPVMVVPRDEAAEASLAENLQKIAMNPADEVEAFATIVEGYAAAGICDRAEQIAHCARRFGRTIRYVKQRLRLAALHPDILAALRNGKITLDAAKAYAGHPDQVQQLKVFDAEDKKGGFHGVQAIRNALSGKVYRSSDRRVLYIGMEAYLAAGGRVEPDLFFGSAEDEDILLDPPLVDRLVSEKASIDAGKLAQAGGWADGAFKPSLVAYELPKKPEGFRPEWGGADKLSEEQRDRAIAIFQIGEKGELEQHPSCFVPAAPAEPAANGGDGGREYREQQRLEEIRELAARLAAPAVADTPFEGRAFWPKEELSYVDPLSEDEDGNFVIALLIKIPKADVEAKLAEAEMLYEEKQAEDELASAPEGEEGKNDDPPVGEAPLLPEIDLPESEPEPTAPAEPLTVHQLADLISSRISAARPGFSQDPYDRTHGSEAFATTLIGELVDRHGARFRAREPNDFYLTLGGVQRSCTGGRLPLLLAWASKVKDTEAYQARDAAPAEPEAAREPEPVA